MDETPDGLEPVRLAAQLAMGPADELVVICITGPQVIAYGIGTGTGPAPSTMFLVLPPPAPDDTSADLRLSVESVLEGSVCGRRVMTHEGAPERVMRDVMRDEDADLIILPATHPRSRVEALVFGDPWGSTIARATVPVLLARPGRAAPLNFLVVLDGPRPGADAVRAIATIPVPVGAQVLLLGLLASGARTGSMRQRQRMVRRTDVAMRMLRRGGLRTAALLRQGEGAADIIAAAETIDADVIVVGAQRERAGRRIDRVARSIMGGSPCSVLLIPALPARRRGRSRGDGDDVGRWAARAAGTSWPETRI